MLQRLNGCRAKIARANEHITDLKKATQSHVDLNPVRYKQYYDADTGTLNFAFADGNEIPMSLNIIIGEALYQQRSALDHLIWQLIDHAKARPTNKSGFPIFTTEGVTILDQPS